MISTTPYRYSLAASGPDRFDVWAPAASAVELVLGGGDAVPMTPTGSEGWWRVSGSVPSGEVDYGYRVDGSGPFPDPRSRRQPEGVHEL